MWKIQKCDFLMGESELFTCASVVSQIQLVERTGSILGECSETCVRLQDALSSVVSGGSEIDEGMMQQIQQLDRISQQLSDLAALFSNCARNFDDVPAAFGASIQNSTKLVEIREKVLGVDVGNASNGDLDLF